jgi:steroid delta-isomerase
MPTPDELRRLVQRYAEAVSAGDPAAVAALFAHDAVQTDPATAAPNVGRAAIETFFENAAAASKGTRFEALAVHTAGAFAAIDFGVTVTLETGAMRIEGIEVFEFDDDGLIKTVTAYWDDADVSIEG